jgi:hypothetical protein
LYTAKNSLANAPRFVVAFARHWALLRDGVAIQNAPSPHVTDAPWKQQLRWPKAQLTTK